MKIRALKLKGYYPVAQVMADTFVEVSICHIMPGVDKIETLSLPEAKHLSKEERAAKITVIGDRAKAAKDKVRQVANAVDAPILRWGSETLNNN